MTDTISFFTCCKNEGRLLAGLVESLPFGLFQEKVLLLDVDSRDFSYARKLGGSLFERVHLVRFADSFGELLTIGQRLCAPASFALWLDCDERLHGGGYLRSAIQNGLKLRPMALPRRRWADWDRKVEMEPGNHDWQARIVPTTQGRFERACHSVFSIPMVHLDCGCSIDHFHDAAKSPSDLSERQRLYRVLCLREGLAVEGGEHLGSACECGHSRSAHIGATDYAKPPFGCSLCSCQSFKGGSR